MTATDHRTVDVTTLGPLSHEEGLDLFAVELDRLLSLMQTLSAEDWTAQTECPDWDVRRMMLHVLGAGEGGASLREFGHQMRASRRYQKVHGGPQEAALSATQVADRLSLDPQALISRFTIMAPACVRARRRLPSVMRKASLTVDGPVVEKWTLGYLIDTIYLRDAWMHRIDVCRATGKVPALTPEHDGRIVADVVAEWSRRHGQPFTLVLDGPAGGTFVAGRSGEGDHLQLDAVEFCRTLSGRLPGSGLLATVVPF